MKERRLVVETGEGKAPLLCLSCGSGPCRGTVLVYHGLGASKEVQRLELGWLAERGFLAVGVDAVGHGARRFEDFDTYMNTGDTGRKVLDLVVRSIDEIPALLDKFSACGDTPNGPFAIVGISLGAFIAYGAVLRDRRLQAAVPILGCPDWEAHLRNGGDGLQPLLERSPHRRPEAFAPAAVLAVNAGQDDFVPPRPARRFMEGLRSHYQDPERVRYLEYPQSGHFMREEDWHDLWRQALGFLQQYLDGPGKSG